ncbi:myogenesis-regulating glycosidase isoform X1 [Drosophila nasuta]|uniref:myogenesis-regulating glycosidase isoform X1 n=2 Tax=Drosophila nasuta TaxID=42062 RepID=UPI00295F363D|nr:myogenesis-regulating glycosidase isoform X1 [Drosophila nasuta]XP_060663431.1 myogenesis-regulating glycosidase isoform X1 [Drosophila nasuta]
MPQSKSQSLLAAQALNAQHGLPLELPYADEDDEQPKEKEQQPLLPPTAIETRLSRKPSLGQRRNVDLPRLLVINELPAQPSTAPTPSPSPSPTPSPSPPANEKEREREHFGPGLRRNSISMPSGINSLELEAMRRRHQLQAQEALHEESQTESIVDDVSASSMGTPTAVNLTPDSGNANGNHKDDGNNGDDDDSSDEFGNAKKPVYRDRFRSRRRASIAPLPALRLNSKEMLASDFDTHSVASNQASITSVNSLASLLREKMQAFPQLIRKKKRETKDYKIKIFVIMMFFIIIFLIGYAYVAYHQQVLTKSYFQKIKFNSKDRIFRILSHEDKEVIMGHLGVTLGSDTAPFHCLEDHRRSDGSVCIEWNGIARLHMNFEDKKVFRCYTLQWQALTPGLLPTDCYELKRDNGLWFGGGITKGQEWSLSYANFDFMPYASGDHKVHQFGNAVKRYFINSIGVAMQVNERTPLQLGINRTENQFCLRAANDDFTFVNRLTELPQLDYKICTTEDMRSLHMLMTQQPLFNGVTEELEPLLAEPVWQIPHQAHRDSLNESIICDYSENAIAIGLGHIVINEFWQENIGDFTVDRTRFPTLNDTIAVLHRRGFKVVFTIQPFISTDSPNFKDAVARKLLIYERHSERSIPALTRYKSSSSAGVLDITNNASVPWLLEKLQRLKDEYGVKSFYLDLGTGYNLPHYYQCRQPLDNPDQYARKLTQSLESAGLMAVSTASVVPKPPTFVSTPPANSTWEGLRETLAAVLNYGVIGYPFVLPGAIGGDYLLQRPLTKMVSFYSLAQPPLPDMELFIRWLQLATFLPVMQFSHLPDEYQSKLVTRVAQELKNVRQTVVIKLLNKYLHSSMTEGLPLVRPLWMLDPHDPACLIVSDEFSVGEELIVAPILDAGREEREVYLPQGVWKDGIDGSLRKGSRWMHGYRVPKDKVAYFRKMPDNTRF